MAGDYKPVGIMFSYVFHLHVQNLYECKRIPDRINNDPSVPHLHHPTVNMSLAGSLMSNSILGDCDVMSVILGDFVTQFWGSVM